MAAVGGDMAFAGHQAATPNLRFSLKPTPVLLT